MVSVDAGRAFPLVVSSPAWAVCKQRGGNHWWVPRRCAPWVKRGARSKDLCSLPVPLRPPWPLLSGPHSRAVCRPQGEWVPAGAG